MPHLSPMNWIIMFLFMFLIMFIINSNMWWKTTSKFPQMKNKMNKSIQKWNWL